MAKRSLFISILASGPALALLLALVGNLWLLAGAPRAQAATPRYVATTGADVGSCSNSASPCASTQYAVDAASPGDEIRVAAGRYTGVHTRPRADFSTAGTVMQVVYISKTISLRGGFTTTDWIVPNPAANLTILDAQNQGRVLYISGNISPSVAGLELTGGNAAGQGGAPSRFANPPSYDGGGGVYVITATAALSNNIVTSNTAKFGGGVFVLDSASLLSANTVVSNLANFPDPFAGGVAFGGGGIAFWTSSATLDDNAVLSNTASFSGGSDLGGGGAGVLVYSSTATVSRNLISGNQSTGSGSDAHPVGGGVYVYDGNTTVAFNTISTNTAQFGGGLYTAFGSAQVDHNLISDNQAFAGGGLRLDSSNATLQYNSIISNTAIEGGGISSYYGTPRMECNLIRSNRASQAGGLELYFSNPLLINNVIADNDAPTAGAIGIFAGNAMFLQTTLARNHAGDGDGIVVGGLASLTLTNSILVSASVGITVSQGSTVRLNGVLWFANGTNTGGAGAITIAHQHTGDPAFAADGYHLLAGSAAVARGVPDGIVNDIDGHPRPLIPDLGAVQLSPGVTLHLFLPSVFR